MALRGVLGVLVADSAGGGVCHLCALGPKKDLFRSARSLVTATIGAGSVRGGGLVRGSLTAAHVRDLRMAQAREPCDLAL